VRRAPAPAAPSADCPCGCAATESFLTPAAKRFMRQVELSTCILGGEITQSQLTLVY